MAFGCQLWKILVCRIRELIFGRCGLGVQIFLGVTMAIRWLCRGLACSWPPVSAHRSFNREVTVCGYMYLLGSVGRLRAKLSPAASGPWAVGRDLIKLHAYDLETQIYTRDLCCRQSHVEDLCLTGRRRLAFVIAEVSSLEKNFNRRP